jgi:hypothetical protein
MEECVLLAAARVDAEASGKIHEHHAGDGKRQFFSPTLESFFARFVRVVSWNIDRDSKLRRGIEFLAGEKADMVWLQEADLNARDSSQQRRQGNRAEAGERTTFSAASFRKLPPGTKASAA